MQSILTPPPCSLFQIARCLSNYLPSRTEWLCQLCTKSLLGKRVGKWGYIGDHEQEGDRLAPPPMKRTPDVPPQLWTDPDVFDRIVTRQNRQLLMMGPNEYPPNNESRRILLQIYLIGCDFQYETEGNMWMEAPHYHRMCTTFNVVGYDHERGVMTATYPGLDDSRARRVKVRVSKPRIGDGERLPYVPLVGLTDGPGGQCARAGGANDADPDSNNPGEVVDVPPLGGSDAQDANDEGDESSHISGDSVLDKCPLGGSDAEDADDEGDESSHISGGSVLDKCPLTSNDAEYADGGCDDSSRFSGSYHEVDHFRRARSRGDTGSPLKDFIEIQFNESLDDKGLGDSNDEASYSY